MIKHCTDGSAYEVVTPNRPLKCDVHRVETRAKLIGALTEQVDLIVNDCTLPHFSGLEALEVVRTRRPDVPFIFAASL